MRSLRTHRWFLLLLAWSTSASCFITVEGFVPPAIDRLDLQVRYKAIWEVVAPAKSVDISPLTVKYYANAMIGAQTYHLPEWGGGGAIGTSLIVVATDASPLLHQDVYQVTLHEMVHAALARAYPDARIPRWFHEGVALLLSGEVPSQEQVIISKAILTNSLLTLASVDSVNLFGRSKAELAYAQSHQAVITLVEAHGIDFLGEVLTVAGAKGDFWAGVYSVMGVTPTQFESAARSSLMRKFQWAFFVADTEMFWVAAAVLFLVGVALTVMRNRRKRARMAAEELAQEEKSGEPLDDESADDVRV